MVALGWAAEVVDLQVVGYWICAVRRRSMHSKVLTSPRILGHQNLLRLNSKVHKLHARLHGLSDVSNGLIVRPVTWLSLLQRDSLLGPQEGKSQI